VKLQGRTRKITFHVFDPRQVEDVLDRNLPEVWREEDALATAENRRRGAQKAALKRAGKLAPLAGVGRRDDVGPALEGWDDIGFDDLLR
jgi:hypothetical protein